MAVKESRGNPDRAAPSRNAVPLLLRLGLTILLLALILRTVSLREIVAALRGASPWPLACGAAFGVVFSALKVFRWGWLLRRLGAPCTAAESLYSYLGGMAVGLLTPGRVGEMARAMYLRTGDRAFVAGAAFLDKVFDVTVVLIVGAAGCAMQGLAIPAAALALAALALYLLIFLPARVLDRLTGLVPIAAARRVASSLSQPLARAGGGTVLLGALQAGAHRCEQLVARQGFHQVVFHPQILSGDHLGMLAVGGQEYEGNGHPIWAGAYAIKKCEAIHGGHADIRDDHIRADHLHGIQRFLPVGGCQHGVAGVRQDLANALPQRVVVFDDQEGVFCLIHIPSMTRLGFARLE